MTGLFKFLTLISLISLPGDYTHGQPYDKLWEENINDLQKKISSNRKVRIFDPANELHYRNRVLKLFTSMGVSQEHIKIMRLSGHPSIDFLFYKGKLYSAMEDWSNEKNVNLDVMKQKLKNSYGKPEIDRKGPLTVSTYKKNRTVVILYQKQMDRYTSRCKVYYYTRNIFNTLFSE